jgi:cell division protein FtsB
MGKLEERVAELEKQVAMLAAWVKKVQDGSDKLLKQYRAKD